MKPWRKPTRSYLAWVSKLTSSCWLIQIVSYQFWNFIHNFLLNFIIISLIIFNKLSRSSVMRSLVIIHPWEQSCTLFLLQGILTKEHIVVRVALFFLFPHLSCITPTIILLRTLIIDHITFRKVTISLTELSIIPIIISSVSIFHGLFILVRSIIFRFLTLSITWSILLLQILGTFVQGV